MATVATHSDADLYSSLAKFCGGPGSGVRGVCPKGKPEVEARAKAAVAAGKLHQAAQQHARAGTDASAKKLQAAIEQHQQLHTTAQQATAEAQAKAAGAAAGKASAPKATGPGSRGGQGRKKPPPKPRQPAAPAAAPPAAAAAPPAPLPAPPAAAAAPTEPTAKAGSNLTGMHKDTFDKLAPTMTKQVGRETATHRQAMAAANVMHQEAPAVQKALAEHLKQIAPAAYEHMATSNTTPLDMRQHFQAGPAKPVQLAPHMKPAHQHVADAVKIHGGAYNLAPLAKVREHLAGQGITGRAEQDHAIKSAQQHNLVSGSNLEGRSGVTPADHAASIPSPGSDHRMGFLSARHAHAERYSEGGNVIRGAEIFSAGVHRGKPYTDADLDQMVSNFQQHSAGQRPLLRVPAVLGHEEDQEYLERSDLPAAAWATNLYREGHVLKADFADVPNAVANLIKGHRYRTISAEVYDEPPEGVSGQGKMLRRVAFLGGDIPQLKSIEDIPLPEAHAEQFATWTPVLLRFRESVAVPGQRGCWACFSEVTPMAADPNQPDTGPPPAPQDPQAMIQQLTQLGMSQQIAGQLGPDELAEVLRVVGGLQAAQHDDDPNPDASGMYAELHNYFDQFDDGDLPDPDAEGQYADYSRYSAARAMRLMERYCGQQPGQPPMPAAPNAEPPPPGAPPAPGAVPPPHPVPGMPPHHMPPKKVTMQYSEVQKLVADTVAAAIKSTIAAPINELKKFREDTIAADKRSRVKAELDLLVTQGRVLPAERPGLDELLVAQDTATLHRFTEADPRTGKEKEVKATAFDRMLASLKSRPKLVAFGERVKAGGTATAAEAEVEKVKRFVETDTNFQHALKCNGKTPAAFVEKFSELRKKTPTLTARDYGVPPPYSD